MPFPSPAAEDEVDALIDFVARTFAPATLRFLFACCADGLDPVAGSIFSFSQERIDSRIEEHVDVLVVNDVVEEDSCDFVIVVVSSGES